MKLLCFSLFLLLGFQAYAKTKIGYSGRLVRSNGQPINGTADLRFDLHYTGDLTNDGVLCWVKIVSVPLSNGVYNVNLDFESGDGACTENFNKVLKDVPANEKLVIRVHDLTNLISFDWQDLLQVPYAYRAEYTSVAETAVESSIGSLEIIDESIKSEDIMNGTIQEEDLKSQAVTSNKIATSTIDDTHIANDSITSANLGVDSVTESEIATGAVRSDEVLDDSLTADDLAPDSVTVSELADNSVDTASIIAGSVTHTKMQGVTGNCPDKRFLETDGMGGFYCGPYQTGDFKSDGTVSMGGDINLGDNRLINALGVRLNNTGGANSNYVELKGPTSIANNFSLTLPADGGASGQVLTSDGSGVLSWTNPVETSRGSVSASSPLTYNSSTGVFGITEASGSSNGYLSNADWSTFTNDRVNKAGDTMTGSLTAPVITGSTSVRPANLLDTNGTNFFDGGCGNNQHITSISSNGAISCGNDSGDISAVSAGSGLSGGGSSGSVTLSHADTSGQGSINASGGTVIQDLLFDGYGHVTGASTINLDGRYYTEGQSDSRFVNVTGDTMSGALTVDDSLNVSLGATFNSTIHANGNSVVMGTLFVNSSATASVYYTHSDRRFKENIQPLDHSLRKLLALNPVEYDWIDKEKRGHQKETGLIAQEVKKIYPDLVKHDKEGFLSVNYQGLISPLISSVKELYSLIKKSMSDVDELRIEKDREIASLKFELKELKEKLEEQEIKRQQDMAEIRRMLENQNK